MPLGGMGVCSPVWDWQSSFMSAIVYAGGGWVTNIGNSFYNLGALYALKAAGQGRPVHFMPDITAWMFENADAYDPIGDVDADLWVFSGPRFSEGIVNYAPLFDQLRARGKRIAFLSVGLWQYSEREWQLVSAFLENYSDMIEFVSTRDRATFERAKLLGRPVFDGICCSMFLPDAVKVPRLDRPPYIVLNFPKANEPKVAADQRGNWLLEFPTSPPASRGRWRGLARRISRQFASATPARGVGQSRVGEFDILRTRSEPYQHSASTVFDRAAMHYSDLPTGYLSIYRSAEVVFTDRVHTAAATLVTGGTAQYFMTTERARDGRWLLLDRIGAADATIRPTRIATQAVADEKSNQLGFLRGMIA